MVLGHPLSQEDCNKKKRGEIPTTTSEKYLIEIQKQNCVIICLFVCFVLFVLLFCGE